MDRLRKVPLPYKFIISAGLAAALAAAYAASKKSGPVPLSVEGETCSPAQDTLPYPASFEAFSFPPLDVDPAYSVSDELAAYQGEVRKAVVCSPYREAIEAAGENLRIQASRFEDGSGGRRDYVFVSQFGPAGEPVLFTIQAKTGSFEVPFFFYTDSKGSLFAPPGEGDEGVPGVLLPVGVWFEEKAAYWGFGIEAPDGTIHAPEKDNFLFKEDYGNGTITFRDPYSGREYSWRINDQQPQPGGIYQVVTQAKLMPEGWVDVNGVPVSPEFIALQEKIAESQDFTLTPAGLEVKLPDGTIKPVSDVKVAPDGLVKITRGERKVPVLSLEVRGDQIVLKSEDGETFFIAQDGQLRQLLSENEAGRLEITLEGEVEIVGESWGQVRVPDTHFSLVDGLGVKIGDERIIVPAAEVPERLKINALGALLLTDEKGKTVAFFEPTKADRGWFVLTQENLLVDSFEKLEPIDGEFLLGPEMLPFLRKLDAEGMIEKPGPLAMPIRPGWLIPYDTTDKIYRKYGFASFYEFDYAVNPDRRSKHQGIDLLMKDPDHRDWTVARIYRTNLFGIDFAAIVFRFNNGGAEAGFEVRLVSRTSLEDKKQFMEKLSIMSGVGGASMRHLPVSSFINPARCGEVFRKADGLKVDETRSFCYWYASNLAITQPWEIFEYFATTGKFENKDGILPITFARAVRLSQ